MQRYKTLLDDRTRHPIQESSNPRCRKHVPMPTKGIVRGGGGKQTSAAMLGWLDFVRWQYLVGWKAFRNKGTIFHLRNFHEPLLYHWGTSTHTSSSAVKQSHSLRIWYTYDKIGRSSARFSVGRNIFRPTFHFFFYCFSFEPNPHAIYITCAPRPQSPLL